MDENIKISVVIPAYNCQETIGRTIRGVLAQDVALEVVVVDDGSTDQTPEIIKSFPAVKNVFQPNAGPACARNAGLAAASGEIVFFIDSDCIPHPDWIKIMLPHFSDEQHEPRASARGSIAVLAAPWRGSVATGHGQVAPDRASLDEKVAVVAGSYGIANPEIPLAVAIHREILFRHRYLLPQYPKVFGSYNFAVRRRVFLQVGGFNIQYRFASGEDNDLSYKILAAGYKIYFERQSLVDHFHPANLRKYLREQYRHGFWRAKMYRQHPTMAKGDDYTFWKDIVEVPLVFIIAGALVIWGIGALVPWCSPAKILGGSAAICGGCALVTLEAIFSLVIIGPSPLAAYFTWVMLLRSFSRTFGFLHGFYAFFLTPKSHS